MNLKVNENVNVLGKDYKKGDVFKCDEQKAKSLMGLKPSFFGFTNEQISSPPKKTAPKKPKGKK